MAKRAAEEKARLEAEEQARLEAETKAAKEAESKEEPAVKAAAAAENKAEPAVKAAAAKKTEVAEEPAKPAKRDVYKRQLQHCADVDVVKLRQIQKNICAGHFFTCLLYTSSCV